MKKKIWDLYAPIYKCAMRADHKTYEFMYARIPEVIRDREVLEIATGPGLLAKRVAPAAKKMIATDYSDGMIAEARKGSYLSNLTFEIADAMDLPDHPRCPGTSCLAAADRIGQSGRRVFPPSRSRLSQHMSPPS